MKEITARKNLISNLKESIKEIDDKYETYTKIYNLLNDFDCDYGTDYADYFREISDFLDIACRTENENVLDENMLYP